MLLTAIDHPYFAAVRQLLLELLQLLVCQDARELARQALALMRDEVGVKVLREELHFKDPRPT